MKNDDVIIKDRVFTAIRCLLFILLIILAIVLMIMYIYLLQDLDNAIPDDELSRRLWDASLKSEYGFGVINSDMILPSLLYAESQTNSAALLMNESLIREYYSDIIAMMQTDETVNAEYSPFSAYTLSPCGEKANERARQIKDSDNFFYISYHEPLPLFIILYYSGSRSIPLTDDSPYGSYINGMFFIDLANGDDESRGFTLDMICENGDILTFEYEEQVFSETLLSAALTDREFISAHMSLNDHEELFYDFAVSFDENIYVPEISVNSPQPIGETDTINDILQLFGYNPDKVSTYSEAGNTDVFVEIFGLLKISPELLSFEGSSGYGIAVSEYVMLDGGASVFDLISVSDGIIKYLNKTAPDYFGGEAAVRLTDIIYADGGCTLLYSYFFENIRIEGAKAAQLSFADDYLTNAQLYAYNVENMLTRTQLMKSSLIYELYSISDISGKDDADSVYGTELQLCYVVSDDDISPAWSIRKRVNINEH